MVTHDSLAETFKYAHDRQQQADQIFNALRANEKIRKKTVALTYRCHTPQRCKLAELYPSPEGVLVYLPPYKRSPKRNTETSSPDGRKVNTIDGERRWKGRAFFIEAAWNLTLNCDHVDTHIIDREQVLDDLKSDRKNIVLDAPD